MYDVIRNGMTVKRIDVKDSDIKKPNIILLTWNMTGISIKFYFLFPKKKWTQILI